MNRLVLDEILQLIAARIADDGYECIEVDWDSKERVVRVYIDDNKGVGLTDCVSVTRTLEGWEDFEKLIPTSCRLEVSSPGVERPLRLKNHFLKAVGEKVRVRLCEKVLDRKQAVGILLSVEEERDQVVMKTDDGIWEFSLKNLKKANIVYDWEQE